MNSSFLTKHLSKLSLVINLTITILVWLYIIGTSDPLLINLVRSYALISMDSAKIIITVICGIWVIKSITAYEAKVIQFVQADLLKSILKELQSSRKAKEIDKMDSLRDDASIDLRDVKF
ncbi:hypothetical protein C2U55_19310 [Enterobacteriaceae bacterium ENNIH3]|nr:hypothetical protein C2U55_19175 [Enterobacteriaceae bacterium ENNIH3]AUV08920.1 hypothetical protein C2U52_22985 [Enterobacteriaceae bacterium ENNIH2]AUU91041.1 hypothetical protein C2U55_19190 [Enterobacteriaceae bacterium ENNIH3]AUU91044.1 hypothetical protein C2U55_19205 [Enterobacteriaceae bacterium ENNIH3]AUU91047.1 hypothetical protein C2U55_19220 [Enterobacteriaceae bacterium ENNIH3]